MNKYLEVMEHVKHYCRKYLPEYAVLEVRRKSRHPKDDYVYMVSAKATDGTYAVWTSWNEETKSLNHGHYGLQNIEDCEKIFTEF